jgi:hypothetical protein
MISRRLKLKLEEDPMTITKPGQRPRTSKLVRKILWRHSNGTGVVEGPFPRKFTRSETRNTVKGAMKCSPWDLYARAETTLSGHYALVLLADITEEPEENDFGPVIP